MKLDYIPVRVVRTANLCTELILKINNFFVVGKYMLVKVFVKVRTLGSQYWFLRVPVSMRTLSTDFLYSAI